MHVYVCVVDEVHQERVAGGRPEETKTRCYEIDVGMVGGHSCCTGAVLGEIGTSVAQML